MKRKYIGTAAGLVVVVAGAVVLLTSFVFDRSDASVTASTPADPVLISELEAHGFRFTLVPDDTSTIVSPKEAAQYASAEYGVDTENMTVYLGRLTELDRLSTTSETGSSGATAPSVNRLSFAVQITGMTLYRRGGEEVPRGDTASNPDDMHHELVVFIDATTGREIVATTFR